GTGGAVTSVGGAVGEDGADGESPQPAVV
ncbi:uncharacterized protein METZ01_LOCUS348790, partial [marine metagenome]